MKYVLKYKNRLQSKNNNEAIMKLTQKGFKRAQGWHKWTTHHLPHTE